MFGFGVARVDDPDFGALRFIYIRKSPESSYWEGDWTFPPAGHAVSINLPGDKTGPTPEARAFMLSRVGEFEQIVNVVRPRLEAVWERWFARPLGHHIWIEAKLAGFGVENPTAAPVLWEVSFETIGLKPWLGITIPMVGASPQEAVVDT